MLLPHPLLQVVFEPVQAITAFGLTAVDSQDLKIRMGITIVGGLGFGVGVWNALNLHEVAAWQTSVIDFGIDTGIGLYLTITGSLVLIGQVVVLVLGKQA
ncbi:hypothetical protein AKJ38_03850 [candidate division MSBL1 archaeon SCGC-AAA259I14]|uniref:Uncharacterized protein n=1 Tax=candidate division MSBL1 archaeon SCGC-AAA259I14 TaxID=1698268 RepID=A0A133UPN0_9EURY|nr:hypothetical protein AKJ38_03850 [candidate division MSBL1 archaeon SCGC-AAA259I14]